MELASFGKVKRWTAFLLAVRSIDPDQRSREQALNALLLGALVLTLGAFMVVVANFIFLRLTHLLPRVIIIGFLFAGLIALYVSFKRGRYKLPTYSLLGLYFLAALGVLFQWGANNPMGLLLCALVVIVSGILLGARFAIYALLSLTIVLGGLALLTAGGIVKPDITWAANPATLYDAIAFGIILGNIAIASWLFNRSMEHSLERARRSEAALRHQKALLEVKVEERTRQVQAAQLERIQELYRFAELGHMSMALLHDTANYLTVLSLDIEDLKQARENRSAVMRRVQQSIRHLDNLVSQARTQIKGETIITTFNLADEITYVMKILRYKAEGAGVKLEWKYPPNREKLSYKGSTNHFWQIIMNILSNGIDAYDMTSTARRVVYVAVEPLNEAIEIHMTDFGKGIPASKQDKIFEPFYSTKQAGSGIGLAIAKRMVEKDFHGTISVKSTKKEGTTFTISLPRLTT